MTSDDGSPTTDRQRRDLQSVSGLSSLSPTAGGPAAVLARRARLAASRRKPWWRWVLIGLLLAFSLTTTGLYAASLIRDCSQHHWGAALDASRDAVPAAVGWAALILLFFPRTPTAERLLSADDRALTESLEQAARDRASMESAQCKVQRLTEKLERLVAAREHAGSADGPAPEIADKPADAGVTYLDPGAVYLDPDGADLDREIAETTARLDQATQWLVGARSAVAVSQRAVAAAEERLLADFPDLARRPDPAASRPA